MIQDIIAGGVADGGLVPLLFCHKLGTKGDYFYHNLMCQTAGKVPDRRKDEYRLGACGFAYRLQACLGWNGLRAASPRTIGYGVGIK